MARDLDRGSVDELLRAITPSQVAEALGIGPLQLGGIVPGPRFNDNCGLAGCLACVS